ncbi:MAG: PqqD family protein [Acidimicrobiales bacterium]
MAGRIPKRAIGVIIEATGDEWIAYSPDTDQAHALNAQAVEILDLIDGRTDIGGLCERLDLGVDVVLLGLRELHEAHLIEYDVNSDSKTDYNLDPASADRRALLMKLGIGSVAAATLPVVETIIAPTRAAAASVPNPTPVPTDFPTPTPTGFPTPAPTMALPTRSPTAGPTPAPTAGSTPAPTPGPTPAPTAGPTPAPTPGPTAASCACSGVVATVGQQNEHGEADVLISVELSICALGTVQAVLRQNGSFLNAQPFLHPDGRAVFGLVGCSSSSFDVTVEIIETGEVLCSTTFDQPCCSCRDLTATMGPVVDGFAEVQVSANLNDSCPLALMGIDFRRNGASIVGGIASFDGSTTVALPCGSDPINIRVGIFDQGTLCSITVDIPCPPPSPCSCAGMSIVVGPLEENGTVGITPSASLSNCADGTTQFVVNVDGVRMHTASPVSNPGIHTFFIPVESVANPGSVTGVEVHVEVIDTGEVLCSATVDIGA